MRPINCAQQPAVFTVSVTPLLTVVVPVPFMMVPLVHRAVPVSTTAPVPVSVPPVKLSAESMAGELVLKFAVPFVIFVGPVTL